MNSIGASMVSYNLSSLDFCFEQAIESCMPFCDTVSVNDGMSTDDTYDRLLALQERFGKDRLILERRPWLHDKKWQERERNYAKDMSKCDWVFFMDADECIHEDDAGSIHELAQRPDIVAVSFAFTHFYRTPETYCVQPSWYKRRAKMGRRSINTRIKAFEPPACVSEIVSDLTHNMNYKTGPGFVASDIVVYHYGHVRDARAMGVKTAKWKAWYANDEKYFDGWLPDPNDCPFSYDPTRQGMIKFEGTHPKYMQRWFEEKERLTEWNPTTK